MAKCSVRFYQVWTADAAGPGKLHPIPREYVRRWELHPKEFDQAVAKACRTGVARVKGRRGMLYKIVRVRRRR